MAMLPSIRDVGAAVWRAILNLWIWDASGATWRRIVKAWVWNGSAWQQFYAISVPTLNAPASLINGGPETGSLDTEWTITGDATGFTLTIQRKFTSTSYVEVYSGANGGSSPQNIPYWGSNFTDPAVAGESMLTDAWIYVELKDGTGVHAIGSPYQDGPGFST